jgi:hypothetical protein
MPLTDRKQRESPAAADEKTGPFDNALRRELQDPALAIAEDAPLHEGKIPVNATGFKKGYDPYDSGRLVVAMPGRRRDLRRLGEWLKLCMQLKNSKQREE